MWLTTRVRNGLSVVAAALIAVVVLNVPAFGGEVPVAHAIPTLQPASTPIPAALVAVVNIYGAGHPTDPDGTIRFEFWIYNTGNLDAKNVQVNTSYFVESTADPQFGKQVDNVVVIPLVKVGNTAKVQVLCKAVAPQFCKAAAAVLEPGPAYIVSKDHSAATIFTK
jgi:hypothetical protein